MQARLLVYFHEVRTPEAVRGENGKLLGFTKPFTDRGGQCCLEVTREQWTELQRHRWASPVLEIGFLIPDVDFVAQDGTVFQDAAECLAHERALKFPAWLRAIEDKRHSTPADMCGNHERVGFLHVDLVEIGTEETLLGIIAGFEHLVASELRDFETQLVIFGTHPAFEFVQVPDVEAVDFYALPKYEVRDGAIVPQSEARENVDSSKVHILASGGSTPPPDTVASYGRPIDAVSRVDFIAAGICSDVVQYNSGEFCNASTELRYQQWLFETGKISEPTVPSGPKPLYSRAWDKLESKMRLGDLAAALGVDADTLKASLQDPLSTVELGHAGWVKRREPKACLCAAVPSSKP